jgi:hypothetical protein
VPISGCFTPMLAPEIPERLRAGPDQGADDAGNVRPVVGLLGDRRSAGVLPDPNPGADLCTFALPFTAPEPPITCRETDVALVSFCGVWALQSGPFQKCQWSFDRWITGMPTQAHLSTAEAWQGR